MESVNGCIEKLLFIRETQDWEIVLLEHFFDDLLCNGGCPNRK